MEKPTITVKSTVKVPVQKAWEYWNKPEHITKWCQASDDWHAPYAENDLRDGGKFKTTMAAKDGRFSFDFEGVYEEVEEKIGRASCRAGGWQSVKITVVSVS